MSCSKKTSVQNIEEIKTDLWKPIILKDWNQTPAINNRVANEDDVKEG